MAILPSWLSKDSNTDTPPNAAVKLSPPTQSPPTSLPSSTPSPASNFTNNDPSTIPPTQPVLTERQKYLRDMQYKTAVAGVILCPIIIFMPPRKIDIYTFGLVCMTVFLTDHLVKEHGHPGLLYAISPTPSAEYAEKMRRAHGKYDGMKPSEHIMAQIKDVWNQNYEDEAEFDKRKKELEEEKETEGRREGETMLEMIRREEAQKADSPVLRMLAEQERKKKETEDEGKKKGRWW
ncbi:hypothetical protein TWF694_006985 [Orbilia ellipsospora]|uniref:Uncharacterized protein n=1 Tax=Orbilia ellipsospora TaxID=2528407 RepID=A0AAV9XPF1_9PEZI